jgi:heme-degrading monooxygenase HmoA
MIRHIVIWKLKENANGNTKIQNAAMIKNKLEALAGRIPGIIKMEVGFDISGTEESGDIVLYSEFESKETLESYQVHPEHKAVMPFVKEARSERRLVDYEVK